jgi:hypothetical protein
LQSNSLCVKVAQIAEILKSNPNHAVIPLATSDPEISWHDGMTGFGLWSENKQNWQHPEYFQLTKENPHMFFLVDECLASPHTPVLS